MRPSTRLVVLGRKFDTDAQAYITAVEAADGAALEEGVKTAINNFVVGCKADRIWSAIKASCILAGARTLTGALVPLVGAAPKNFNFVSTDYNRKTGLAGDGTTKYLDSNRLANADNTAVGSHHGVYISTLPSFSNVVSFIGSGGFEAFERQILRVSSDSIIVRIGVQVNFSIVPENNSYMGASYSSGIVWFRTSGTTFHVSPVNASPSTTSNIFVFARNNGSYFSGRLAFYSIGEFLNLALLDARITTLINAYTTVIA